MGKVGGGGGMFRRRGGRSRFRFYRHRSRDLWMRGGLVGWSCAEPGGGFLRCSIAEEPRRIVWRGGVGRVLRRSRRESPIRRVRGLWIVEEADSFSVSFSLSFFSISEDAAELVAVSSLFDNALFSASSSGLCTFSNAVFDLSL